MLALPAGAEDLVENAELIADAVAERRNLDRSERIHITGGESPEPSVPETGLFFLHENLIEVPAEFPGRLESND